MEYRVLGPLEVQGREGLLQLGGPQQRALLALLVANANRVLAREWLIDELWGESAPETAVTTVQVYVSRLRKVLADGALRTQAPGYVLTVDPEAVDLIRFERLVAAARSAEAETAATWLREALALWRGPPLTELGDEPFARAERGRLADLRLAALEDRLEADLELGRHAEVTAELEALVTEHPHRERLNAQLIVALYRSGRQADALDRFRAARAALDELGLEPGAALKRLERQVLTQDVALDLPPRSLLSGPVPLPGPLVPASRFPFVGRGHELEVLRTLLAQAEAGQGGLVLVGGEAGAGKTRLVREFARLWQRVRSSSAALTRDVATPYESLREWFEFLIRVCDPAALRACLDGPLLTRLVPDLEPLTGPPADGDRYQLQSAAVDPLVRMSRIQPLVLIADDVHWADTETLRLLRRLAAAAPEAPLLAVAAYRDRGEERLAGLGDLLRLDAVTRVSLPPLVGDDVSAFVRASTGADVTDALAAEIVAVTEGAPLLLCELWRDLGDSGAVEVEHGSVRLTGRLADVRGSERIGHIVERRLARVVAETSAVVEMAAVAGPSLELGLLADAAGLAPAVCLARLDDAAAVGLLEPFPAPAQTWRFTHELVRRAVYDRLERSRLAGLHLAVGEALERSRVSDSDRLLSELAHHFALAASLDGVDRALDYNVRAARAALAAAAFEEGVTRFRTALDLGVADPYERVRLEVDLGDALFNVGRLAESESVLAGAIADGRRLGDQESVAWARIRIGQVRLFDSDDAKLRDAQLAGEEALAVFSETQDERGLAAAWGLLANCRSSVSQFGECHRLLLEALGHAERAGDPRLVGSIRVRLGHAWFLGPTPVQDAIAGMRAVIDGGRASVLVEAEVSALLGVLEAMRGRFADARRLSARSAALFGRLGETFWLPAASFYFGSVELMAGDPGAAERELRAGYRAIEAGGASAEVANLAAALAEVEYTLGRFEDARRHVDVSRDTASGDDAFCQVAWRRTAARLLVSDGDLAGAAGLAGKAVTIAAATDCLNAHADALLAQAEVERAGGRDPEASLTAAFDLYAAKGNTTALAQTRAAFAGLATDPG